MEWKATGDPSVPTQAHSPHLITETPQVREREYNGRSNSEPRPPSGPRTHAQDERRARAKESMQATQ